MQELPLSVYEAAEKIFVDTPHAKRECGDISIPLEKGLLKEDDVIPFSEILKKPELKNKGVNVFKSVGMALFDITCADVIYRNANKKGLGTEIEL
jgi:ornithine cyclodeaminase